MGVIMGHVVGRLGCCPVDVARPGGGGSQTLGRHCETLYSARQVSMGPGLPFTSGIFHFLSEARGSHPDPYHRSHRPRVANKKLVGSFPMGLDRLGLGTDIRLPLD